MDEVRTVHSAHFEASYSMFSVKSILDTNKSQMSGLEIDSKAKSSKRHSDVWKDSALDRVGR